MIMSLRYYLDHLGPVVRTILIVVIPVDIISWIIGAGQASSSAISPFLGFAQIIMNVALLYGIAQTFENRPFPKLSEAYYDGSSVIVRYLLVLFLFVLMMLPALFGAVILALAFVPDTITQIGAPEQALMSLLAVIFALPSIYLVVRNGLGLVAVVREDLRPFAALRASRLITHRRFWPVFGHLIGLLFVTLLISAPTGVVALLIYYYLKWTTVAVGLFQLVTTITTLPITAVYCYQLYLALEERFEDATGETHDQYVQDAATSPEDKLQAEIDADNTAA